MHLRRLVSSLALAVATLPTLAAEPAAPAGPIPIDAFVHEDQYSNPKLSPDGRYLAVTVRMKRGKREVPTICVLSLPKLTMLAAVQLPVFEIPANYLWVSNTRMIVSKAKEIGSREAPRLTGEVLAMNFDGSKQEYLYGFDGFKYNRQGGRYGDDYGFGDVTGVTRPLNNHVFVSSQLWRVDRSQLYDIDSNSSIRKLVADIPMPDLHFVVQPDGKPRFAMGFDDHNEFVLYRKNGATDNWDLQDRKTTGYLQPFVFSPDGSEFGAKQSLHGGPEALVREDSTGARTLLLKHPDGDISDFLFGSDQGLPLAATTQVDVPKWHYISPEHPDAQLHKQLSAQFPGNVVDFINFTDDGKQLLFKVASDRDPGSFYLFDRATGKADFLMAAMESIEPELMAERKPVTFKARDGLALHGYLTLPPHPPASGKPPLILLPHGGPIGPSDTWYFDTDAQFLASRGYAVLQVNYRGSGGRGYGFRNAGYRQWGLKIQDDLIDGVKWVQSRGYTDPARSCVYGGSFGGYSALMLAAREGAMFRCAVGYAGVYDLRVMRDSPHMQKKNLARWFTMAVGESEAELMAQSPALLADKITIPVMLVHGGKDERALKENAFRMRDALIRAGRPPEWLYVDYEGHGFYDTENLTNFYQMLENFLAKHLK
jgi:dipeptidyl aminopeptidase/acylaminoacyl peptidase